MDQELIAFLNEHFRDISRQIADLREETGQHFDQVDARFERVETTARQTLVLIEGLRHEVHLVAEAYLGLCSKVDLYQSESRLSIDDVRRWMEKPFQDLDNRIRCIEVWKERRHEDVMDEIRRSLGKSPLRPPVASD
jgi:hypothetical protein